MLPSFVGKVRCLTFLVLLLSTGIAHGQYKDLPISMGKCDTTKYLLFHITGDGGWRGYDMKLIDEFKGHGISYVSLNALKYFWDTKTPGQLVNDIVPVLRDYFKKWDKKELILVGFSFGAEIMPFFYTRLPDDLKKQVREVVIITPASTSDFTIHLTDMIGADHHYAYDVVKEVEKIKLTKVVAFFGENEDSTFPVNHKQDNFKLNFVKGNHHFTDGKVVVATILKELK
jgi:type IV secretory pathway VirJ component